MVGIGAVLGALTLASLGPIQGRGKVLLAGACGFGISLIAFSQSPIVAIAAVFTLLAGLCNGSYMSQDQTIIQLLTPKIMRGRVLGVYLLNRGLQPVGSLLAGALAQWLGGRWAVTVMGSSCLLLAIMVAILVPAIRTLNVAHQLVD